MKKCSSCKVVFHLEERTRCLYCDRLLFTVSNDDSVKLDQQMQMGGFRSTQPVIKQVLQERKVGEHARVQYLFSSYFRCRTFGFTYKFSRNEFIMGEKFKRVLVQPVHWHSFLMIPWVFIDMLDSLYVQGAYKAYCKKCAWKYVKVMGNLEHDPKECDYNREYSTILNNIISGDIVYTEKKLKDKSQAKVAAGHRSAYKDLCTSKKGAEKFSDILCVWLSISILVAIFVMLTFPIFMTLVQLLDV